MRYNHFPHFSSTSKIQKKKREREKEKEKEREHAELLVFLLSSLPRPSPRRGRFSPPSLNSPPFLALQIVLFLFANASPIGTQKPVEMGNVSEEVPDESEREGESRDAGFDAGKVSRRDGEVSSGTEVREV